MTFLKATDSRLRSSTESSWSWTSLATCFWVFREKGKKEEEKKKKKEAEFFLPPSLSRKGTFHLEFCWSSERTHLGHLRFGVGVSVRAFRERDRGKGGELPRSEREGERGLEKE